MDKTDRILGAVITGVLTGMAWFLFALVFLAGCATSHARPYAPPDGGAPTFQGDASPDGPECLAWGHPEGYPEDVRCTLWAGDAGARGCKIAPFYGPGDPAGACAR